jgi:hypothetical protein
MKSGAGGSHSEKKAGREKVETSSLVSSSPLQTDVAVLMRHIHTVVASAAAQEEALGIASNPLWVVVIADWEHISAHLAEAERAANLNLGMNRLPNFPLLTWAFRSLGGRVLLPVIRFPVLVALRVMRHMIREAIRQQQQFNQSLVGSSLGVAHRLKEYEAVVQRQGERLAALEEELAARETEATESPPIKLRNAA